MKEKINIHRVYYLISRVYLLYFICYIFFVSIISYAVYQLFFFIICVDDFLLKYLSFYLFIFFIYGYKYIEHERNRRKIIFPFNEKSIRIEAEFLINYIKKNGNLIEFNKKYIKLYLELFALAKQMQIDLPEMFITFDFGFTLLRFNGRNIVFVPLHEFECQDVNALKVFCAHEMAHVKMNDILFFSIFIDIKKIFCLIVAPVFFLHFSFAVFISFSIIFYFILYFLFTALSFFLLRLSEYAADAIAVKYTQNAEDLITYFKRFNNFQKEQDPKDENILYEKLSKLFNTHPDHHKRIISLKRLIKNSK